MIRMMADASSLTAATPATGAPPGTGAAPLTSWWRMPAQVWRGYLLGCGALFLVYLVASETDGDFSRGFDVPRALLGALRGVGPAFVLLLLLWSYTGWLQRRGFSAPALIAQHLVLAVIFAVAWHASIYAMLYLWYGVAEAERARGNWFIWQGMWGMMMYGAAAGGFSAYRAIEQARIEAAASAQAQALLARTELAALRNKLNPHFLFNTLHSILALVRRDARAAEDALLKFSDLLRHVLETERSGEDQVPLQQELDFTRDYLALEALRLGERLQVAWELDPDALHCAVPALSVQPLVENSIKHAFAPRSERGQLRIAVRRDRANGLLNIEVSDDGPGGDAAAAFAGQGLGLKTVARRLELAYPGRGGLRVVTAPGAGFAVHLQLPADD